MKLLVDIGNSYLKWICEQEGQLQLLHSCDYRQDSSFQSLIADWKQLPVPDLLVIACVAQSQRLAEISHLAQRLWPDLPIMIPQSQPAQAGVVNAYPQAGKLGVDRWLVLLAAQHFYPGDTCIVDCGTAITLDFLNANGQHLGGLISPGLGLMQKALLENTAALNLAAKPEQLSLADNTGDAIANGTLSAALGLIETALQRFGRMDTVLITGGDASLIAQHLPVSYQLDPLLLFKGLVLVSLDLPENN